MNFILSSVSDGDFTDSDGVPFGRADSEMIVSCAASLNSGGT